MLYRLLLTIATITWLGQMPVCGEERKPAIPAETQKALQLLQSNSSGNWWSVRVGAEAGACSVNWGANERCLIMDGRRFRDAVSFTGLMGWYAPVEQLLGVVFFDNGESLIIRCKVKQPNAGETAALEGSIAGFLTRTNVDASFTATRIQEQWSLRIVLKDSTVVQGILVGARAAGE